MYSVHGFFSFFVLGHVHVLPCKSQISAKSETSEQMKKLEVHAKRQYMADHPYNGGYV